MNVGEATTETIPKYKQLELVLIIRGSDGL